MLPLIRDGILFCLLTILCCSAMHEHQLPSQQVEDVPGSPDVQPEVQPAKGVETDEAASSSHGIGTSHDIQQFMADLDFVQVQFATVLLPFEHVFEAKEAHQVEYDVGHPEGHGAVHPRGLHVVQNGYSVKEMITNFKHLIETQCHYENGQVNDGFQQALRDSIVEFVSRVSKQTAGKGETVDIFFGKIRAEMEKRTEHEKLLANLEQVEKRLKQRQIRWHIHYIQDKQKHGNKNVVEDEGTKVGFFYFLYFHTMADELHRSLAEKMNNFKGDNQKEENVLNCQLMVAEWLKKYLAKELESKVIMDKILGHDKGELVKQAVMLSLKLLTPESNFDENQEIEEAFGLQKSTDDECDVNGMHTKTVEFIQSKLRKLKLGEKDYKKIAEKINTFLVIFWAPKIKPEHPLDLDTMSIQKCLGEATKEVENEIKGKTFKDETGDELKTHQILRFYGHFFEKLLNVPNDIETSEKPEEQKKGIGKPFAHWLNNLKKELLI